MTLSYPCLSCLAYGIFLLIQFASGENLGVGFSLSLDYGTSAIYFANGTSVGVAKIEGSPEYKRMMRLELSCPSDSSTCQDDFEDENLYASSAVLGDHNGQTVIKTLPNWRDYLPPWLGGKQDPRVQILVDMQQALKTATESYLESSFADVEIVFPYYVSGSFRNASRAAAQRLSMNMPVNLQVTAAEIAAVGDRYRDECNPEEFVLSIDYSRAALTAMCMISQCGMYGPGKGFHDASYGTDNWSDGASWKELVADLRTLVSTCTQEWAESEGQADLPPGADAGPSPAIGKIVFSGESGSDKRLRGILKEVLLQCPDDDSVQIANDVPGHEVDPLFAAAIGTAVVTWEHGFDG